MTIVMCGMKYITEITQMSEKKDDGELKSRCS